ncbi:GNAT family N-acetyltransferase [Legionella sp. D16C41]|uniref:GNAT family N-acetyltransferase n=1 Tax=Legionella sp. D16C41 TaxID=3402688 RepID=UPI003AF9F435
MLIRNRQLSSTQLKDLNKLAEYCVTEDKGLPTIYYDILVKKRETEGNVLFYDNNQLIGFLALYFFYEHACEASLLIMPTHRNQGLASKLFIQVISLLKQKKMAEVILSFPAAAAHEWLEDLGFSYHHSEFYMVRQSSQPSLITRPRLAIRQATFADLNDLCKIDASCFAIHQDMAERFAYLLNQDQTTILLALKNKIPIGKAHIQWKPDIAHFSDISILPPQQKKGLGSELLAHCINEALNRKRITLDLSVEANNQRALKLYQKHGFEVRNKQDYWSISLEGLQALLPRLRY